jgi:hypothetical protein
MSICYSSLFCFQIFAYIVRRYATWGIKDEPITRYKPSQREQRLQIALNPVAYDR